MTDILLRERQPGILRLTLNDPKTRNSLSEAMMASLAIALDAAKQDDETRVIVIAAEGPAFCSGHNLKEIAERRHDEDKGKAYFTRLMAHCAALMQAIVHHPRPVIAEVNAPASAAGPFASRKSDSKTLRRPRPSWSASPRRRSGWA